MADENSQQFSVEDTLANLLRDSLNRVDNRSVPLTNGTISLPKFFPGRDDPEQWTNEISEMVAELGWSDSTIMAQIGGCFEGEAGEWFNVWSPIERRSWANLNVDLCESFYGTVNFGKLLYDAMSFCSDMLDIWYSLIKEYHDGQAHVGLDKTILSIASHFWFPRMRQFAKKYIDSCLTRLTRKRRPRRAFNDIHSIPKIDIPFHTIHIDLLGPLPKSEEGFTHIFVAVDAYSKYTFLYAVNSLEKEDLADCVQDIVFLVDTPARTIADNGSSLKAIQNHLEWNIEWHFITPYVHQSNGQVERYMRFVSNLLRVQAERTVPWSSMVSRTQLVINSTVHKTTRRTPLQTLFGCDNRLPEISRIIEKASEDKLPLAILDREKWRQFVDTRLSENAIQENYAKKHSSAPVKSFTVGDFVLISREALKPKKLESGWVGPYKITKKLPNNRYELRRVDDVSESIRMTVAVPSQMRLWTKEWFPEDCAEILESYLDANENYKNDNRQDEAES